MQNDIFDHRYLRKAVFFFEPVEPFSKLQVLKKREMPWLIFVFELSCQKPRQFLGAFLWYESFHEIAHDFQFPYSLDEVEVGDAGENLFGSGHCNSPGRLGASEGLYLERKLLE